MASEYNLGEINSRDINGGFDVHIEMIYFNDQMSKWMSWVVEAARKGE
ncbi:hypothetical protein [Flagellimonas marinaquae]